MPSISRLRRPPRVGARETPPRDHADIGLRQTFRTRHECLDHHLVLIGENPVVRPTAPKVVVEAVDDLAPPAKPAPVVDVEASCRFRINGNRPLHEAVLAAQPADHDQARKPDFGLVADAVDEMGFGTRKPCTLPRPVGFMTRHHSLLGNAPRPG